MDPEMFGEGAPITAPKAKSLRATHPLMGDDLLLDLADEDEMDGELYALMGDFVPSGRDWLNDSL
ncbi:MAG: hypothetical protein MRY63_13380 [Neomegalonema sp.]|nr:hypothetical protein [Neomegalonema sp.]